jgi:hypothetical protein
MRFDYPHMQKSLDSITHISAEIGRLFDWAASGCASVADILKRRKPTNERGSLTDEL